MFEAILTHIPAAEKATVLRSLFTAKNFDAFMEECAPFINSQPARLVVDLSRLRLEANKRSEAISRLLAHAKRTTSPVLRNYLTAVQTLSENFRKTPTLTYWSTLGIHADHCVTLMNEMQSGDLAEEIALVAYEALQEGLAKDAEALIKQIGKTSPTQNDKVSSEDVHEHGQFVKALEKEFKIEVHHFEPVNEGVFVYMDEPNNDDLIRQLSTLEDRLDKITEKHGYVMLRKGTIDDIYWGSYPNGLAKWMFIKVDLTGEDAATSLPDMKGVEKSPKKLQPVEAAKKQQIEKAIFEAAENMDDDAQMMQAHHAAALASGDKDTAAKLQKHLDGKEGDEELPIDLETLGLDDEEKQTDPDEEDAFSFDDTPELETTTCQMCGGDAVPMGVLGNRVHYRCANCGMDSSQPQHESKQTK